MADYFKLENRFKMLDKSDPRAAKELLAQAQADVSTRRDVLRISRRHRNLNPSRTRYEPNDHLSRF